MRKNKILKEIGLTFICAISTSLVFANHNLRDSIGVENQGGKKVILHKIDPKETYYSLGRKYQVSAQSIMDFNTNKALKTGEVIQIPTGQPFANKANTASSGTSGTSAVSGGNTEYTVKPGETLFAVARRFGVSVGQIKAANHLTSDALQAGQTIKIPGSSATAAAESAPAASNSKTRVISDEELNNGRPKASATTGNNSQAASSTVPNKTTSSGQEEPAAPVSTEKAETAATAVTETAEEPAEDATETKNETPANRYGIKQVSESGIGVWVDDLSGESGKMLALHNTAPVGSVIKLTNPMTNRTTYAKVVGKFTESEQNKGAIVVISKPVASLIGVIDRRFQVNISY